MHVAYGISVRPDNSPYLNQKLLSRSMRTFGLVWFFTGDPFRSGCRTTTTTPDLPTACVVGNTPPTPEGVHSWQLGLTYCVLQVSYYIKTFQSCTDISSHLFNYYSMGWTSPQATRSH